ncbi:MAG: hypothetical protein JWQ94_1623 [Tardiphaga sp.]|jgi:uncharacterized membrane protein YccC|nr:hypothetical protein [Tardiphaga sp.]
MPLISSLLKPPPGTNWSAVGFALRTTAASLIALYLAFLLNLDDPKWAAMTVWIVAQGSRGMSLSKGQYRFAGTVVGAAVAMLLTALFAQTPEIFLPALALWLGLCTALSTGLRNFRSYGAVLAGYSAAIIAMDAVADPADIFNIAVARVSYIGLGIVVEAVMAMIFVIDEPVGNVRERLGGLIRQSATVCALALRGDGGSAELRRLFTSASAVDTAAEYAAAVSAWLRRRVGHLRAAMIASFQQVAIAGALREASAATAGDAALVRAIAELMDRVAQATPDSRLDHLPDVRALAARIETELLQEAEAACGGLANRLALLFKLQAMLSALETAVAREHVLGQPDSAPSRLRVSVHVDHTAALHNGVRAFIAVLAAAALWIFTAWPAGASFVTIVGVVSALFATRPNPVAGGLAFLKGSFCAVIAAGFCNFAVIPAISGFVPLALVMSAFLIPAGLAMRDPRTAAPAASFAIFFWDLIGPDNLARADAASFFNGALVLLLGIGIGTLIFALVIPADLAAARQRLYQAVRRDLAAIGRNPRQWSMEVWVSRTADRVERHLVTNASGSPAQVENGLRALLAILRIGDAAIDLYRLLPDAAARRPVDAVMRHLAALEPERLARTAHRAAARLARRAWGPGQPSNLQLLRAAALLREIGQAAAAYPEYIRSAAERADSPAAEMVARLRAVASSAAGDGARPPDVTAPAMPAAAPVSHRVTETAA